MRIDDLSAFIQAHKLVSGRSCPEFVPSDLGVGCAYFNALQTARRIHSENAGGYIPLYAKSKYGLSRTFFMADDTPVYFLDLTSRKANTNPPPASRYRINLAAKSPYYVPPVPSNPISEELLEKVYRREITSNECI